MHENTGDLTFSFEKGVSLVELVPIYTSRYKGAGPKISDKILWLTDQIEQTDFWLKLHQLLDEDIKIRHSAGGVFYRETGSKEIGPYTWHKLYSSLDHFLKPFNSRATEFLFRDFVPNTKTRQLIGAIASTRYIALDIFPRLRRLYLNDYLQVLNTSDFWAGLLEDLNHQKKPVSINSFLGERSEITNTEKTDLVNVKSYMEKQMILRLYRQAGNLAQRAQLPNYRTIAQIMRDEYSTNPRSFLINFIPTSTDVYTLDLINNTKKQIELKVLENRGKHRSVEKISLTELKQIVEQDIFWQKLTNDLTNHMHSKEPVYNFNFFLRHFVQSENEVVGNRIGNYAYLCSPFVRRRNDLILKKLKKPSEDLVLFLMWNDLKLENGNKYKLDAKQLVSELFEQDCLYIQLQLPEFWKHFENSLKIYQGTRSFQSFLRFFSNKNYLSDPNLSKGVNGTYQKFLHRSYHQPEDLKTICGFVGLRIYDDYQDNLKNLWRFLAPMSVKKLLEIKFPNDFDFQTKSKKEQQQKLLQVAKEFLIHLSEQDEKTDIYKCSQPITPVDFKSKIQSAARTLNLAISTKINGQEVFIRIKDQKKLNEQQISEYEDLVYTLRSKGLKNKSIAELLEINDYQVEFFVGRLIKHGRLARRY